MWDPRPGGRCKIYFILSRQQSIDMRWYNYFSPNYRWHNSYWLIFLEFEFCEYIHYGYRYSCKIALKIFFFIWKQLLRYPYWSNFKTRSISPYSALFQASNVLLSVSGRSVYGGTLTLGFRLGWRNNQQGP